MKKEDKTQALLENPALFSATLQEFADKPYGLASTNEIIKKSNYNKGSFYYRFDNKQDLFVALMDYLLVIQIDIYNQRRNKSSSSEDLENLLFDMFSNLYHLYKENPLYYKAVTNHLYDNESKIIIENECIEPLKYRILKKLQSYTNILNINHIVTLVDNLYQSFPKKILLSSDFNKDLTGLIKFLLADNSETINDKKSTNIVFDEFKLTENPAYILLQDNDFSLPEKYISMFDAFFNFKKIRKKLCKLNFNFISSYEVIVKKLIKKSFKNANYLINFIHDDILKAVRLNKEYKKFLLISLYYTVTETPYITYDLVLKRFSQEENMLFYQHILPIMSKTSKIIVLNTEFSLYFKLKQIYVINSYNEIKAFDYSILQTKYLNSYEIEYYKQNTIFTKTISSSECLDFDFNKFIKQNKIIVIRKINKIDYDTLTRNEDFI